jgi:PPM family protein phosphatase
MTDQTANAVFDSRLVVRASLRTDVGKVRSENQDFGTLTSEEESRQSPLGGRLLVVADGMGGHRGGATASRLAGETVKAKYLDSGATDIPSALRDALALANRRIYSEAQSNPDLRGMGTTTSALAVRDGKGWFAHVGDSRIYLIRGEEIKQLTDDHSLVATMMREGLLTAKEAENHPRRNVLQRSVGVGEDVEIDVRGPFELREGDIFILCSDGLHGLVKEDELKEVARLGVDEAAEEFVRRALERGAPDNVTVIVARVERAQGGGDDVITEKTYALRDTLPNAFDETVTDDTVREVSTPVIPEPPSVDMPQVTTLETPVAAAVAAADSVASAKTTEMPLNEAIVAEPEAFAETIRTTEVPFTAEPLAAPIAKTAEVPLADSTVRTAPPSLARTTEVPLDDLTIRTTSPKTAEVPSPAAAKRPAAAPPRRSSRSVIMWTLLFVLALGAAGAWLFWKPQQNSGTTPTTTSAK